MKAFEATHDMFHQELRPAQRGQHRLQEGHDYGNEEDDRERDMDLEQAARRDKAHKTAACRVAGDAAWRSVRRSPRRSSRRGACSSADRSRGDAAFHSGAWPRSVGASRGPHSPPEP